MASSTPNLDLTLPVGGENVSRQIINANNVKIDEAVGAVPSGTDLQSQVTALNNKIETYYIPSNFTTLTDIKSALQTYVATIPVYQVKRIIVHTGTDTSLSPFSAWNDFIGYIVRFNNDATYWTAQFLGIDGRDVEVGCNNGTITARSINNNIARSYATMWGKKLTATVQNGIAILYLNHSYEVRIWLSAETGINISVTFISNGSNSEVVYSKTAQNSISFGENSTSTRHTITRSGNNITITTDENNTIKVLT